jgi:hypothetical protein
MWPLIFLPHHHLFPHSFPLILISPSLSLNSTMFDSSNKTAMEVVVHFLLTKLDPSAAAEAFKFVFDLFGRASFAAACAQPFLPSLPPTLRFCWPIMDHRQEKAFRKEAGDWLKRIAEVSRRLAPAPALRKTAYSLSARPPPPT